MKINRRFIVIILLFLLVFPSVKADEDQVYLYVREGEEKKEKIIIYGGEYDLYLRVIFGNNCSNFNIKTNSPLFAYPLGGIMPEIIKAGQIVDEPIDINPDASFGNYPITVYLNYTDDNNCKVSKQFNFTIEYKKAFEIKELKIPSGGERKFSLTIETYEEFTELKVIFDSDGDIETEKDEVVLNNISAGKYKFETEIYEINTFPGDAQELGYWIIGIVNNRTVEQGESNIPVRITWYEQIIDENKNYYYIPIIIMAVIIILGAIIFYYKKINK